MSFATKVALDDMALVRTFVAERSEESFRALYRAHSPYLFALALRLTGGRQDEAEEALQEAWVRAVERLDRFRGGSALRTWLGGIVVNCTREARRRRHGEVSATEIEDQLPEPLARDAAPLLSVDLDRAIASLPAAMRDVVVLYEIEGMTHEEVGERLGIPAGTSKSRLSFARRALRGFFAAAPPQPSMGESR